MRIFATPVAALALIGLLATSALAADHKVLIKGHKFQPAKISLKVGDTITFTNEDGAPHTATASDGAFDTGRLSQGESAKVAVNDAGDHAFICKIHPSMKGVVSAK